MTIKEAHNFYTQDEMRYDIMTNKEFLLWYNNLINNGYISYMNTLDIQELINNLVNWYEIKYPEKEFEKDNGINYPDYKNLDNLAKYMTFDQLLYRLSNKEISILKCPYRTGCGGFYYNKELEKDVPCSLVYFNRINTSEERPLFYRDTYNFEIDSLTGKVIYKLNLPKELRNDNYNIEDLYKKLKSLDEYNLKEIEKCLKHKKYDELLRNKILELTVLKILYSKNTIPEYGYKRARIFIDEFNQELNLNLSKSEIDLIMMKDYSINKENMPLNENELKSMIKNRKRMIKEIKRNSKY
ncbi:MAG: hypothetical protein IKN63_01290 [Bacilli bacterium]|nr:hypothetical protein [Bacilli bacterium]